VLVRSRRVRPCEDLTNPPGADLSRRFEFVVRTGG
jgi:hypothetical protein